MEKGSLSRNVIIRQEVTVVNLKKKKKKAGLRQILGRNSSSCGWKGIGGEF